MGSHASLAPKTTNTLIWKEKYAFQNAQKDQPILMVTACRTQQELQSNQ